MRRKAAVKRRLVGEIEVVLTIAANLKICTSQCMFHAMLRFWYLCSHNNYHQMFI
jgi:hypothetical protein